MEPYRIPWEAGEIFNYLLFRMAKHLGGKKWGQVFQFITGSHQPLSQVCVAVVTLRAYFSTRKSTEGFILGLPGMLIIELTIWLRHTWNNNLLFHSIERKSHTIGNAYLAKQTPNVRLSRRLVNGEFPGDVPVSVSGRK